ncbi:hypothetical protein CR513_29155, partial [Mucuna pruriens]
MKQHPTYLLSWFIVITLYWTMCLFLYHPKSIVKGKRYVREKIGVERERSSQKVTLYRSTSKRIGLDDLNLRLNSSKEGESDTNWGDKE